MQSEIAQMICGFKLRQGKRTDTDKAWTDAMETASRILALTNPKHEAPAEGAGERTKGAAELQAELDQLANEYGDLLAEVEALRARSSAPEAREGEAVGVVYSLKADLNTAELPDGTLLYTHPAAPSADHAELTRLAEAAGGEAWSLNDWRPEGEILVCGGDGSEYGLFATVNDDLPEVAAFIAAANPATVLALLSEIAALKGERDGLKNRVSCLERLGGEQSTRVMEQATRAKDAERQRDELRKALGDVLHIFPSQKPRASDESEPQAIRTARALIANQGPDQ